MCTAILTPANFVSRCRADRVPGDAYAPRVYVDDAESGDAIAVRPAAQSNSLTHVSVNHRGDAYQHILVRLQALDGEGREISAQITELHSTWETQTKQSETQRCPVNSVQFLYCHCSLTNLPCSSNNDNNGPEKEINSSR